MKDYDRIFDLLVELSDKCDEDGLTVTSQRLELALDALLAETEKRPVRPAAPTPIPSRVAWREAERQAAKRRVLAEPIPGAARATPPAGF